MSNQLENDDDNEERETKLSYNNFLKNVGLEMWVRNNVGFVICVNQTIIDNCLQKMLKSCSILNVSLEDIYLVITKVFNTLTISKVGQNWVGILSIENQRGDCCKFVIYDQIIPVRPITGIEDISEELLESYKRKGDVCISEDSPYIQKCRYDKNCRNQAIIPILRCYIHLSVDRQEIVKKWFEVYLEKVIVGAITFKEILQNLKFIAICNHSCGHYDKDSMKDDDGDFYVKFNTVCKSVKATFNKANGLQGYRFRSFEDRNNQLRILTAGVVSGLSITKIEPISSPSSSKPIAIVDEYKKSNISEKTRQEDWATYSQIYEQEIGRVFGEIMCPICRINPLRNGIRNANWECGHILAEKKDGETDILNLRPICTSCNRKMGTKHMAEYILEDALALIQILDLRITKNSDSQSNLLERLVNLLVPNSSDGSAAAAKSSFE